MDTLIILGTFYHYFAEYQSRVKAIKMNEEPIFQDVNIVFAYFCSNCDEHIIDQDLVIEKIGVNRSRLVVNYRHLSRLVLVPEHPYDFFCPFCSEMLSVHLSTALVYTVPGWTESDTSLESRRNQVEYFWRNYGLLNVRKLTLDVYLLRIPRVL